MSYWRWCGCLAAAVFSAFGIGYYAGREEGACPGPMVWTRQEVEERFDGLELRLARAVRATEYWRSQQWFQEWRRTRGAKVARARVQPMAAMSQRTQSEGTDGTERQAGEAADTAAGGEHARDDARLRE